MEVSQVKKYILSTIGTYNREDINQLYHLFKEKNKIIRFDPQISFFDDETIKDDGNKKEVIKKCIENLDDGINIYEDNLFLKGYKYSVYYKISKENDFLKATVEMKKYSDGNVDILNEQDIVKNVYEDKIELLINKKYERFDEIDGHELFLHYPMLIIYYKDIDMIEFRFDALKNDVLGVKRNADFFAEIIAYLKDIVEVKMECKIEDLNLKGLIKIFKDDKSNNKIDIETKMHPSGGKTTLRASENNYILPIIGDLKNLINGKLKKELENNAIIRIVLEEFLNQYDTTTDCQNIEVTFDANNDTIAKRYKVQFKYHYFGRKETLVCFMYNKSIKGNERMNNVAKFIGKNINKL